MVWKLTVDGEGRKVASLALDPLPNTMWQVEAQLTVWQLRSVEASMRAAVARGRLGREEVLSLMYSLQECQNTVHVDGVLPTEIPPLVVTGILPGGIEGAEAFLALPCDEDEAEDGVGPLLALPCDDEDEEEEGEEGPHSALGPQSGPGGGLGGGPGPRVCKAYRSTHAVGRSARHGNHSGSVGPPLKKKAVAPSPPSSPHAGCSSETVPPPPLPVPGSRADAARRGAGKNCVERFLAEREFRFVRQNKHIVYKRDVPLGDGRTRTQTFTRACTPSDCRSPLAAIASIMRLDDEAAGWQQQRQQRENLAAVLTGLEGGGAMRSFLSLGMSEREEEEEEDEEEEEEEEEEDCDEVQ